MLFYNTFYNGQPKTATTQFSTARLVHTEKCVKNMRLSLIRNTDTGICNSYLSICYFDENGAAIYIVADCIGDQIIKRSLQQTVIA